MDVKKGTKIKILYFIDFIKTEFAGTEGQLLKMIDGMDADKFDVKLVCLENNDWIRENSWKFGCPVYVFDVYRFRRLATYLDIFRVYKLIKIISPDIVHTFFPISNVVGVIVGRMAGVKNTISSRRDYGQWMNPISLVFTRLANLFVKRIVVNSDEVKEITIEREGVEKGKIDRIYNGIYLSDFVHKLKYSDGGIIKRKLRIPDNYKVIGIVANHRPMKYLHTFLEAAEILLRKRRDLVFILVGDGFLRKELEDLAVHLKVDENVFFVGRERDVLPYLSIFDIGVNCSKSEGLSNAVMEYMAAKIPCVITNMGGNPSLITNNVNGFLFELGDSRELADKVNQLLGNKKLCQKFVENAFEFVKSRLDISRMISDYSDYYSRLKGQGKTLQGDLYSV